MDILVEVRILDILKTKNFIILNINCNLWHYPHCLKDY